MNRSGSEVQISQMYSYGGELALCDLHLDAVDVEEADGVA